MARKLTDDERRVIAKAITDAPKADKLSNVSIAEKAGYDEHTVRNVLSGNTASYETYEHVCVAVGLRIETILSQASKKDTALEQVGGYSRESCPDRVSQGGHRGAFIWRAHEVRCKLRTVSHHTSGNRAELLRALCFASDAGAELERSATNGTIGLKHMSSKRCACAHRSYWWAFDDHGAQ